MTLPDPPDGPEFDEEPVVVPSSLDPTVNTAEPAEVQKQAKKRASKKRDEGEFWRTVFSTKEGREAMWGLLSLAGTFEMRNGISANGSYDPTLTHFYAGQKAVGHHYFMMWMGFDPDGVLQMMREHNTINPETPKRPPRKTPTWPG